MGLSYTQSFGAPQQEVFIQLIPFTPNPFARKPEPLASCEGEKSIMLKMDIVKQLQAKVTEFHKHLTDALIPDFKGSSCFNDQIAKSYLNGLKDHAN